MKILPGNVTSVVDGEKQQPAITTGAVGLRANHYCGMKGIENVSIGKDEGNNLCLAFSVQRKLEFRSGLQDPGSQLRGNSIAARGYSRNGRNAHPGRLGHILDSGFRCVPRCSLSHLQAPLRRSGKVLVNIEKYFEMDCEYTASREKLQSLFENKPARTAMSYKSN